MSETDNILIIGGGSAIATELIRQTSANDPSAHLYVVSRSQRSDAITDVSLADWIELDSTDADAVAEQVSQWREQGVLFNRVISTIGVLHSEQFHPEKRLEDIDINALMQVFTVNTASNANWLKYAPQLLVKQRAEWVVFSARVGSISDNRLGGWYSYRMSKAALNMLVKTAAVELQRRLKQAVLVSYHPGTVDTPLSEPFQANVKPEKLFTPAFTAKQLLTILPELTVERGPHYIDWQGEPIPW
ncbi:SDR family oxidoreductase [Alteromonas sp. ASW11-36]|uniref:SDR family oxidoreductase n=1 Tax=Alteromonas arenosi TaxID=3055817 RepID=A0ABT7T0W8_9ALTE|nr:SDR family oxidoreductase [Alteromonas sp. ASW11-36]MDM7861449.1 SDR family oxidoreductase [Alteromonas sp. ASW11-36]